MYNDSTGVLVVLVPEPRPVTSMFFTVPSGVNCIIETRGHPPEKDPNNPMSVIAEPGLYFAPFTTRVAYAVTKQMCSYDAPVKRCPTSDNVLCSVDLTIVFNIFDPYDFVYQLGAAKFDDLLSVTIEEKVRKFIRELDHTKIHSLRGDHASALKGDLNGAFKGYGVAFHDVKVTGVWLPTDLANKLEMITKQEIRMETIAAQHEYSKIQVQQTSEMRIEEIRKKNEQLKIQEESKVKLEMLNKEKEQLKT